MPKLIAGGPQDNEAPGGVPGVELVHLGVIPGGCSSERRHVLNEHNFSPQRGETQASSGQQLRWDLVEPLHVSAQETRHKQEVKTSTGFTWSVGGFNESRDSAGSNILLKN